MSINKVQFQKGLSMLEFFDLYGSQAQCEEVVRQWRWPGGFVCLGSVQLAVSTTVEEVKDQSNRQPEQESKPVRDSELGHQITAGEDAKYRKQGE